MRLLINDPSFFLYSIVLVVSRYWRFLFGTSTRFWTDWNAMKVLVYLWWTRLVTSQLSASPGEQPPHKRRTDPRELEESFRGVQQRLRRRSVTGRRPAAPRGLRGDNTRVGPCGSSIITDAVKDKPRFCCASIRCWRMSRSMFAQRFPAGLRTSQVRIRRRWTFN